MWNSFWNIFKGGKGDMPLTTTPESFASWKACIITKKSPRLPAPADCSIRLWDHQRAMLYRCRYIEEHPIVASSKTLFSQRYMKQDNVKKDTPIGIGIMKDPPGAGKTYAMLALAALDPPTKQTLVVAPKNIVSQWEDSITAMFGGLFPWTKVTYESINRLYVNPNTFSKQRILLMDETLIDAFGLAFEGSLHRVVFDEIDNLSGHMTQPINTQRVWFMSASFNPDDADCADGLPYTFDRSLISKIICYSDATFVQESVNLEEPDTEICKCDDADISLFRLIVPDSVITSLHGCNIRPLVKHTDYDQPASEATCEKIARWYLEHLDKTIDTCKQEIQKLEKKRNEDPDDPIMQEHIKTTLEITEQKLKTSTEHVTILESRLADYRPGIVNTKQAVFETKIIKMIEEGGKWLIFNDDLNGLFYAQGVMENHDIKSSMLDGGTSDSVAKAIKDFKEGDTQVLLINSASEGCGLNLENSTHMLFMHATNPSLVGQIVGRAQRPGRKNRLHIIGMFNSMEMDQIVNGGLRKN